MKNRKSTRSQKIRSVEGRDIFQGERSPYWDWTRSGDVDDHGGHGEHPQANPDMLPETGIVAPSTPQLLLGEAIQHMQGRQKEVYILTMREGRSLAEAAKLLGIEKSSAQKYRERAIKFLTAYCREAMARGRV